MFNNKASWWPAVLFSMSRAKLDILINDTVSDGGIERLPSGGLLVI